jgi:hypothetical protein
LSSSLLPSSSPSVEKEKTIRKDTSGGAGLGCIITTCQLGLYVLTVVVAFL